ncbi:MAG: elongation factor G [Acidobacteriota bacterium]
MKVFDTADIRNVGFIGHGDSGKTTLISSLLNASGAVKRLGSVDEGTAVTDFDPEEIERKISLATALAHCEWAGKRINLIDTPGDSAFVHEASGALKVSDVALSVVCGVAGVEVQTEKTWRFASDHRTVHAIVVNKLDRERADFDRTVASLQTSFGREVVPVQLPIGKEAAFRGVVDLVSMKAYTYAADGSGNGSEGDIPADLEEAATGARQSLVELVAESNDSLLEKFFEEGELGQDDLVSGLRSAIQRGKIIPALAVAGLTGVGVDRVATTIVTLFPSPDQRAPFAGKNPTTQETGTRGAGDDEPLCLFVFKTMADPFAGRISLFRVISGTATNDAIVHNFTHDSTEKLSNLSIVQGKDLEKVAELRAGDLGAIAKLKSTTTGDTLGAAESPFAVDPVALAEGVISFAITPKSRGDEDKLSNVLARLVEEDPGLHTSRDPQTHEFLLSGSGQKHVEVTLAKMKHKFGVDCELHPPKVPYRETIKKRAEAGARHKKQTGGHGQFAECKIAVEPLEKGSGYEFVDKIFGGSISQGYRPAVDKGIREAAAKGYVAGYPMSDFRVTLLDGKEHPVDSSEMAFKIAASMAFKECMQHARPTLLEPIMSVEIETTEEFMGDIMGDLNSRRGRVQGMDTVGNGQVIRAQVPMAEILTYAQTLKSITGGRGSFHLSLSHYEEVPAETQKKLIAQRQAADAAS